MCALFFGRHRNPIEEKQKSALLTSQEVQEVEPLFLSIVFAYRYKLLQPGEQIALYLHSGNANYISENVRSLATSIPADKMIGFVVDRYVAARHQGYHPSDVSDEGKSIAFIMETAEKEGKDPRSAILSVLLGDPVSRPIGAEMVLHKYILHLVNEVIRFYRITKRISGVSLCSISTESNEEMLEKAQMEDCFSVIINSIIKAQMDSAVQLTGFIVTGDPKHIPTAGDAREIAISTTPEELAYMIISAGMECLEPEDAPDFPEKDFFKLFAKNCNESNIDPAGQMTGYVITKDISFLPKAFRTQYEKLISGFETDEIIYDLINLLS